MAALSRLEQAYGYFPGDVRLALVYAVQQSLHLGLTLLGLRPVERM